MEQRVSAAALILATGPRLARDAFGPVVAFYVAWKLLGLTAGISAATAMAFAAFWWERRKARTGLVAQIGLVIALVQAAAGLASGSARAYLAPPVIINAVYGLAFLGSVVIGRPLAGIFAQETYPFPPEVKASAIYRRTFSRISLVWAAYLLSRSAIRLLVLLRASVDAYVAVNLATGMPLMLALIAWSMWYAVRSFQRRGEPGASLRA
jgi:intracellular septation protein A